MDILKKIKNYTLNERHCLGQGSFGKVYEAMSDQGKKVAIKKIDQKIVVSDRYLKQSLDNEIMIMQKLKHPNIVQLFQVITTANNIYLVMQFCSGGDLKRYCSTRKVNQQIAFNIIKQIVRGFQEMSKNGIIHRDLKPANILVHQQVFKICDFGFAKFFGQAGKMARTCVGTPIYMSPQILKQKQYTSKADVWSLGVMFYQLLFGRLPYTGFNQEDLFRNISKNALQIPQCSRQALKILQGTLVIDQNNRWGWPEVFEAVLGKSPAIKPIIKPNTPLFYQQVVSEKKINQYQPGVIMPRNIAIDNYFVDEPGYQRNRQAYKKQQQPRNIMAYQNTLQDKYQPIGMPLLPVNNLVNPVAQVEDNPRFFYFVLVQFIVNPIEAPSFDCFLYTLWRQTIQLYDNLLQKTQLTMPNASLYKRILANELVEVHGLQGQMKIKKQGNLRNLAQILYKQGLQNVSNKKRMVWLKRIIDKQYTYEPIE